MRIGRYKGGFSIIVVPVGGGKPRSLILTKRAISGLVVTASVILVLVVLSLASLGRTSFFAANVSRLKQENKALKEESRKLTELKQELSRVAAVERRLLALLGLEPRDAQIKMGHELTAGQGLNVAPVPGTANGVAELTDILGAGTSRDYSRNIPVLWPVDGEILEEFSYSARGHRGLDIAASAETPVRAAGDGVVEFAGADDALGKTIIINHGSGITSLYAQNSRLGVGRGDLVIKGQVVAYSGASGMTSLPHLHFEISRYGRQVNPLTMLSER